ncbi:hypothetical protein CAPTEDRAFT_217017 [Capitella teleta]|uniref:G-protein coupled receptors family 1 profile domain-containing protein n=1 Tax=Capitella teleta TaxID=283909 RepID=R7TVJ0_CAPTE|nr:hypothetical protein CAPTEDRAFT_217017 [Capitella teleta]|eukprot:ELT95030.1 hypothetical protein CAPTEDRAFT_217017 [Capitella teleta]
MDETMGFHPTNHSMEHSDYNHVLFVYNASCMVLSLLCNVAIICVISSQKKAKSTPNITMISVATADALAAAFVIPTHFVLTKSNPHSHIAPFICKLHVYVWYWCKTTSIYSIIAMLCDRYNRLLKPLKSHANISGRYMFYLSFVWFFGAAYNIWEIVLNSSIDTFDGYNLTYRPCGPSRQFYHLYSGFMVVDLLVIFIFPFTIVSFFFSSIFHDVLHPDERVQRPRLTGRRRLLLSVGLFIVFYVCHLPFEINDAMTYFSDRFPSKTKSSSEFFVTLSFSQGLINAVTYMSCGTELHEAVMGFFLRHKPFTRERSPALIASNYPLPEIVFTSENSPDATIV